MSTMTVRELMTQNPYTMGREASLADVFEVMNEKNVRHVPIVDADGRLLGLVSHRDIVAGSLELEENLPVSEQQGLRRAQGVTEVMTSEPETVTSEEDLHAAGELMLENKFGCLPVVDGDQLVGILTESDFVRYVVETLKG